MIKTKPLDCINPTLVKEYSYCPVLVWLKSWFLLEEPVTDSMLSGKEITRIPEGEGCVYVRGRDGSTIIDELRVEKDGSITLVERKAYKSHNYSRYVEQTVSSYVIARTKIGGIRRAKLEVQGVEKSIELNEELVNDVEKIMDKIREILKYEKPPPRPAENRKCRTCWFRRFCPYC